MFTIFHGTLAERAELQKVMDDNCICLVDPDTMLRAGDCPTHHILSEQRTMDGFMFERSIVQRLLLEEWCLTSSVA